MKEYTIRMVLQHCEDISPQRLEKFIKYHNENPHIFLKFHSMAKKCLDSNSKFSGVALFIFIRYDLEFIQGKDGFKINNNYISIYTRLLEAIDPKFSGYFKYRKIKENTLDASYDRDSGKVGCIIGGNG